MIKFIPTKKQYEEWSQQLNNENAPENSVKKGPYINALCKALRRLIPDDQIIELVMGDGGIIEVNGIDIGVHLLCLLKDIPDTAPVIDPRPCEWEPNYNRETWETDLSAIGMEYPDKLMDIQNLEKEAERLNSRYEELLSRYTKSKNSTIRENNNAHAK
ncbi:MAG: hypothetical protein LBG94_03890 [Treponema sp.]|nr:hypothetical protein [Treponema sp.]